jgi:hypothetical protein
MQGFHFYAAFSNYTEETASSLEEFLKDLRTIAETSIIFHFQRKDFQKWISDTIGDTELADQIDKIDPALQVEEVRKRLVKTLQARITKLEKLSKK